MIKLIYEDETCRIEVNNRCPSGKHEHGLPETFVRLIESCDAFPPPLHLAALLANYMQLPEDDLIDALHEEELREFQRAAIALAKRLCEDEDEESDETEEDEDDA